LIKNIHEGTSDIKNYPYVAEKPSMKKPNAAITA
jgi:hypothetical protein